MNKELEQDLLNHVKNELKKYSKDDLGKGHYNNDGDFLTLYTNEHIEDDLVYDFLKKHNISDEDWSSYKEEFWQFGDKIAELINERDSQLNDELEEEKNKEEEDRQQQNENIKSSFESELESICNDNKLYFGGCKWNRAMNSFYCEIRLEDEEGYNIRTITIRVSDHGNSAMSRALKGSGGFNAGTGTSYDQADIYYELEEGVEPDERQIKDLFEEDYWYDRNLKKWMEK